MVPEKTSPMTPERFNQISDLYEAALECEPDQRAAFLQQSCGGDGSLRQQVESLLASGESAEAFFSRKRMKAVVRTSANEPCPSLVGQKLDHYHVLSVLGVGGMGEVYRAHDTTLGREVAIKVLPAAFTSAIDRLRLEREARAASALNHPNILTIYEIRQVDKYRFIVTELIEGERLRDRLRQGRMKLRESLDVAIQIASALSAAHAAGIVHRDIKPENIMLRRDALVKVLDFGLARLPEPERMNPSPEEPTIELFQTDSGVVLGTCAYMSPEQARGLAVDARSDIWSLGVVLYEMVAGRAPFEGATKSDVLVSILEREPPPLTEDTGEHAAALKWILHKALRKEKEERYQTARELLGDLKNVSQELDTETKLGRSIQLEPSGRVKQKQTRRRFAFAVLLGVITLAAFTAAWYKFARRNQSQAVLPPAKIVAFTTFHGRELQPTFSPDGNQIAFAWNGEKDDNFDIYVKLVNTATPPLRLTFNHADDLNPAWSPDGHQIAFVRQSGSDISIFVVPTLGGPERKLYSGTSAFFLLYEYGNTLSWSADGKYLAFSGQRSPREPNSIFLLSLESFETRAITSPPAGFLGDSTPAFSPDGKVLAFVRGASSRDVEIYVMPAAGGEPKRLTFDNRSGRSLAWTADGREILFSSWLYGNLRLWRVSASGGTPEQVAIAGEGASTLAISRQGDRLAYSREFRDTDIWRVGTSGSATMRSPTRLISSTRPDYGPQYSPDGKRIAFTSGRSGSNEIWVCDADGVNPVQLTSFGGPDVGSPRWSPDSRQIAFDSVSAGNRDIFVVSAEGGKTRRLTEDTSDEVRPSWSRDGQGIYFGSNRTGEWQVWKAPSEGGRAVQVTKQGAREAFESFDGKFVYYTRGFGVPGIWKIPTAGGEEIRVLDEALQGFWALLDKGIYFVNPKVMPRPTIDFFDFATGRTIQIAAIEKELQLVSPSLAVSPDGRWLLYAKGDRFESDIMLVENFH
jgi:Tol biopolymer transport system component